VGSKPLFFGFRTPDHCNAYPLDPTFASKAWLLCFIDPTLFQAETLSSFLLEMHSRYSQYGLHFVWVLCLKNDLVKNDRKVLEQVCRNLKTPFISVLDFDGTLVGAFGVKDLPEILMMSAGNIVARFSSDARAGGQMLPWRGSLELETQKFLRFADPGLPLLLPFRLKRKFISDSGRVDFGRGRGALFNPPGFPPPQDAAKGMSYAEFKDRPSRKVDKGQVYLRGKWFQDADRLITSDPEAKLGFICSSENVGFLAESLGAPVNGAHSVSRVLVESGGVRIEGAFAGRAITHDDQGRSIVKCDAMRFYTVLKSDEDGIGSGMVRREIDLGFPGIDKAPIAIYGIVFGDTVEIATESEEEAI